jgi:hypothetical protein
MVFDYPITPHQRLHGPRGYTNYQEFKPWLRDEFTFRCVFCLIRERAYPNGQAAFCVDHLVPQSQAPQRTCDYENLVYACSRCNSYKGAESSLLDPCEETYGKHLSVRDDGMIEGLTPEGERLIALLRLDHPELTECRQLILDTLRLAAESSTPEAARVVHSLLAFPDDLPNLSLMRPPQGNTKPEGISSSYFGQRELGLLPATY